MSLHLQKEKQVNKRPRVQFQYWRLIIVCFNYDFIASSTTGAWANCTGKRKMSVAPDTLPGDIATTLYKRTNDYTQRVSIGDTYLLTVWRGPNSKRICRPIAYSIVHFYFNQCTTRVRVWYIDPIGFWSVYSIDTCHSGWLILALIKLQSTDQWKSSKLCSYGIGGVYSIIVI